MYISDIFIKNFQSHEETLLSLSPLVNAFTGDTDSGKSAIFRALNWLFNNRPTGDEFRSSWGGATEVSVCFQPINTWLGRVRDGSKNYYWIGDDVPENRHSGFGTGTPPKAVLDLINMGTVNFQAQMTLPFLLSLGSTKVGKFFNESADLEIIDRSYANIDKKEWKDRDDKSAAEKENKLRKEQLKQFHWIDNAEKELKVLESLQSEIKKEVDQYNELAQLADDIEAVQSQIDTAAPILKAESKIKEFLSLKTDIDNSDRYIQSLDDLVVSIEDQDIQIAKLSVILSAQKEIQKCIQLSFLMNEIVNKQSSIIAQKAFIETNEQQIKETEKALKILDEKFHAAFPGYCPLCEREITK